MDPTALPVLLLLFSLALIGFLISRKTARKAKKLGAQKYSVSIHMHGLPGVPQSSLANLFFLEDKIVIEAEKRSYEVLYSQVTAAGYVNKSELLTKDKTVVGRGVVGGLLYGPIGAIVGGMSGIGEKKIKGEFLILNYISSGLSEPQVLIFDVKNPILAGKLAKFVNSRVFTTETVSL